MSKLEQLLKQQQEINAVIEAEKTKGRLAALANVRSLRKQYGITMREVKRYVLERKPLWAKMEQLWRSLVRLISQLLVPNVGVLQRNDMNYLKSILFVLIASISQPSWSQAKKTPAGEITSLEWNILGNLVVSYAVGRSGQSIEVHCTAFNEEKKPVGGGFSFTAGGVARVSIDVPEKYKNTDKVRVSCTP